MILDKNQIYIIDNFVNKEQQEKILKEFYKKNLNLAYYETIYKDCNLSIDSSVYTKMLPEKQFVADLYDKKTSFLEQLELKLKFKIDKVIRSKINWVFRHSINNKNGFNAPHTDVPIDHWVLLYYVNESDGDTLMFKETHKDIPFFEVSDQTLHIMSNIEHKMGRGVLFHGSRYHCALPPIESDFRITFNHNFTIKE